MRLVPHAAISPHRCAVIPFKGNSNSRGFIDTGYDLPGWDPHVYISVEAVEQMAQLVGWTPPGKTRQLDAKVARQAAEVEQLKAELAEHQKFREAAEYTLSTLGKPVRRKPGRPPKEKVT